jgi:hypothetical protein
LVARRLAEEKARGYGEKEEQKQPPTPDAKPTPISEKAAPTPQSKPSPKRISKDQVGRLWTIVRNGGMLEEDFRIFLAARGFTSSKDITVNKYDKLIEELEQATQPSR